MLRACLLSCQDLDEEIVVNFMSVHSDLLRDLLSLA